MRPLFWRCRWLAVLCLVGACTGGAGPGDPLSDGGSATKDAGSTSGDAGDSWPDASSWPDAGPMPCNDECSPSDASCGSGADFGENDIVSCADHDLDGCLELGVVQSCNYCLDSSDTNYQATCVECIRRDDCAGYPQIECDSLDSYTCVPASQWNVLSVNFEGTLQTWNDCYYCDATYQPSNGSALIRFQVEGGWQLWSLYLYPDPASPGQYLQSLTLTTTNDPDLPAAQEGGYQTMIGGTISFSTLNLSHGGAVAGQLIGVVLQGGNDSVPHTVVLNGPFYAEFPP